MAGENGLRQLQLAELEVLRYVIKLCEENNISYYLMGGTFLGAIRHKGFIPWDDDIDIGMQRKDYEKFIELVKEDLPENMCIDYFKDNKNCLIYAARIEDNSFKVVDKSAAIEKTRNAWIDIFPLDGMPNFILSRKIHEFRLLYLRLLLKYSEFSISVNQNTKRRPLHEKILMRVGQIIDFEKILDTQKCLYNIDKALKKYDYDKSKYVVNFMGAYKFREMFPKSIYDETAKYEFEGLMLTAPKDYDYVNKQLYGDYMALPPEDQRNKHGLEIANNSNTEE